MDKKHTAFVEAYLNASSIIEAAQLAGISRSTATRYLQNAEVKETIKKAQRQRIEAVTNGLQGMLGRCGEILAEIIEDPATPQAVKIQAIQTIYANARAFTEQLDLAERLEAIEDALQLRG